MRRTVKATLVLGALALVATACGSAPEPTSGDAAPTTRASEPVALPRVAPEAALDDPPLRPAGAVPIASDDDHIWLSDFQAIATYDRDAQAWTTTDLPWEQGVIDGMVLASAGGSVTGVALICASTCETEDEDEAAPVVRPVAFKVATGDGGREVTVLGDPGTPVGGLAGYSVVQASEPGIEVLLETRSGAVLLEATDRGLQETATDRRLDSLCRTSGGYVGFEVVAADEEFAVAWAPLPDGWTPDPGDAKRLVTGATIESLDPAPVPEVVRPVLADWVGQATVCLPGGIALVGTTDAWELTTGAWTHQRSTMSDRILNEEGGWARPPPRWWPGGPGRLGRAPAGTRRDLVVPALRSGARRLGRPRARLPPTGHPAGRATRPRRVTPSLLRRLR